METENSLRIVEENDCKKFDESSIYEAKKKLKLQQENHKENHDLIDDDFESAIEKSMQNLEETSSLNYDSCSGSEEEAGPGKGGNRSTDDSGDSDGDEEELLSHANNQLIEATVLQRRKWDEAGNYTYHQQQVLPFYERRRLSECLEEEDEEEQSTNPTETPTITQNITEVSGPKRKFIVTKAEETMEPEQPAKPVSILKKTPSPPSAQKIPSHIPNLPKKIRIEAEALKNVSRTQNSQTIHFPCSSEYVATGNTLKNLFSPQRLLTPNVSKKYFDTSLVEIRPAESDLTTSTKSLDKKGDIVLDDEVWVKRGDIQKNDSGISGSNSSLSGGRSNASVSYFLVEKD
jgi:hypothetical protein